MKRRPSPLKHRLAHLTTLVSAAVDCVQEASNNVERAEWDFAVENLHKLFANATALVRERDATIRAARQAERRASP